MATVLSILAWRIPWTEEPGGLQSMGGKELNTTERLSMLCFIRNAKYTNTEAYSILVGFCSLHFTPL